MNRMLLKAVLLVLGLSVFSAVASADEYPIGLLSFDATGATSGEFDIANYSGGVLLPSFSVLTPLTFSITSLTVNFVTGPSTVLTSGDFTSDGFGGFTGNNSFNIVSDAITSAVLLGTVSPTTGVSVNGVGTVTLAAAFDDGSGTSSVTLSDVTGGGVQQGDNALINAVSGTSTVTTPEPGTGALLGMGFAGLMGLMLMARRRRVPGHGLQAA